MRNELSLNEIHLRCLAAYVFTMRSSAFVKRNLVGPTLTSPHIPISSRRAAIGLKRSAFIALNEQSELSSDSENALVLCSLEQAARLQRKFPSSRANIMNR